MAPGVAAHEIPEIAVRPDMVTRVLLFGDQPLPLQLRRRAANELDAFDDRVQVLSLCIVALLEIPEIDAGGLAWIRRAQGHLAGPVARVRLEDRPGEIVEMIGDRPRVPWKISLELPEHRHAVKIGERARGSGAGHHAEDHAVARIDVRTPVGPVTVLGIPLGKLGRREDLPVVEVHAVHHADLVAILEVPSHTWEIHPDGDAVALPRLARPDPG